MQRLVSSHNPLQEAWEVYHGDPPEGFDIPAAPPSYMRGFVDGVEHERLEMSQRYDSELNTKRNNRPQRLVMQDQSDSPETDAMCGDHENFPNKHEWRDFARRLEIQRDEALMQIDLANGGKWRDMVAAHSSA
jgi:hypothetical protein